MPELSADERYALILASDAAHKRALAEYLALPDANQIVARMRHAESASEALVLIEDAKAEAWRIRAEMVNSWDDATMGAVWGMLESKVGEIADAERRLHPVIGPVLSVYYGVRLPEFRAQLQEAERLVREQAIEMERAAAKKALAPQYRLGAAVTNEKRENQRMMACVAAFVEWAKNENRPINIDAVQKFPKQPGMALKRGCELLGTLITALEHPSAKNELASTLEKIGFKHALKSVVDDCLEMLQTARHKLG